MFGSAQTCLWFRMGKVFLFVFRSPDRRSTAAQSAYPRESVMPQDMGGEAICDKYITLNVRKIPQFPIAYVILL